LLPPPSSSNPPWASRQSPASRVDSRTLEDVQRSERMSRCVLDLEELGHAQVAVAGGKGAHLAELSRIPGVRVPPGFCITTGAFRQILETVPSLDDRLDRLRSEERRVGKSV